MDSLENLKQSLTAKDQGFYTDHSVVPLIGDTVTTSPQGLVVLVPEQVTTGQLSLPLICRRDYADGAKGNNDTDNR